MRDGRYGSTEKGLFRSCFKRMLAMHPRGLENPPAVSHEKRKGAPVMGWENPRISACKAWRGKSRARLRGLGQGFRDGRAAAQIDRVADQRMADMGEVDADLVRAAGGQAAGDQCGSETKMTDYLVIG